MISDEQTLLTVAEIGVAFAGFASIVTAFRHHGADDWSPQDALRFQMLIIPSLSAMLLALLPFALGYFGVQEPGLWRAASTIMGAYVLAILALVAPRAVRLVRSGALLPAVALPSLGGALVVVALQFCNATNLGVRPGIAAYFTGLLYLLLRSAASFARLLPIGRRMR